MKHVIQQFTFGAILLEIIDITTDVLLSTYSASISGSFIQQCL